MKFLKIFLALFCIQIIQVKAQTPGFKLKNLVSTIPVNSTPSKDAKNFTTDDIYQTADIAHWEFLKSNKEKLAKEKSDLTAELINLSETKPAEYETKRKEKKDRIEVLKKELATIETRIDSVYRLYVIDYLQYKNCNFLRFGPERSSAFYDILYGEDNRQFRLLANTGINFGTDNGSIYSEIVGGHIGIFRMSLGAMLTKSAQADTAKAKKDEAIQRLTTLGGNTVLKFEYPLAYLHTNNSQYNFISRLIFRGNGDLPAFGTASKDFASSGSVGIDLYADASTDHNEARFFANFNVYQFIASDALMSNLKVTTRDFAFGQLSVGVVILTNVKISFVVATLSSQKALKNASVIGGAGYIR